MKIITVVAIILLFAVSSSEIIADTTIENYEVLLNSESYVSCEEAYIHIAGGFFSVFEGRCGIIINSGNYNGNGLPKDYETKYIGDSNTGYIKMKLNKLEYISRFVYKLNGKLIIKIPGYEANSFTMEKLDYVKVPDHSEPCYRLSGSLSDTNAKVKKVQLICFAEGESNPVLYGGLYITDPTDKVTCYPIRISGRRDNEADNHLHKVIARVSHFTF